MTSLNHGKATIIQSNWKSLHQIIVKQTDQSLNCVGDGLNQSMLYELAGFSTITIDTIVIGIWQLLAESDIMEFYTPRTIL